MGLTLPTADQGLPPEREEALSRAHLCPWAGVDDLTRREARHTDLLTTLFRLTGSVEASLILAVVLAAYDACRRSLLIAGGMLGEVAGRIDRVQARAECPVILSVAHTRLLKSADRAVEDALSVCELLGDWQGDLRERAG